MDSDGMPIKAWIPFMLSEDDNHLEESDRAWWKWILPAVMMAMLGTPIAMFIATSWLQIFVCIWIPLFISSIAFRYLVQRTG